MKYIKQYWDTTLILIFIWCILSENFSLTALITALISSILTITIVHLLFSSNDSLDNYRVRPYILIWFMVQLLFQILVSSINTTKSIFLNNTNPTVVEIETCVHNQWFQCLIANSITLTPGTVTIDKTDHHLQVLWLYPTTNDPKEQARIILGSFEKILKRGDYKR